MSRLRHLVIALGLALAVPALAVTDAAGATDIAGTWRSAPDELTLATEFDESVWGKDAKSVRTVEMAVKATGEATLTVTRQVVDARGRTVKGSLSVEEARLQFTGESTPAPASAERLNLGVTVTAAERRYPDDPDSRWPMEGLRVGVTRFTNDPNVIEVRVDTPEGRGSFWETLRRGAARGRATPRTP